MVAVLIWVGLSWAAVTTFGFVYSDPITGEDIFYTLGLTVILGLWMWRVWDGGPMAVHYMRQLLLAFGVFAPGGVALLVVFTLSGFEMRGVLEDWPTAKLAVRTLPVIAFGVVSFTLSRMLRRPIVRAWISARAAAGRPDARA
ncbi:hypothetical protein [Actinomadura sp. NBRC 104412]|uniref:hypothetical protein n=1 Tax=Actinomadura sp. NBRC 104412 TaxID=3032203 RepID=UPI002554D962|nr:hypothetical protein [Actinomadura sp. NBRC 104412]